ncbi:enoyl-CoA delta isomerase 3, peroxisomal isoform X2 [Lasioglossum baleicum]|uniref:enoyl-CoA delta isomerase 3, peroxisomal isoform X2 n=1 Tax=Lasioglossum baleicum TaxID=434251 RepID=UPI003FCD815A
MQARIDRAMRSTPKRIRKMYKELSQILQDSIQDNNIQAVIFTGTGEFFSSGNDFTSVMVTQDENSSGVDSLISSFKNFVETLISYPKLLIAIVNGPAIGIATTMLPLCDMVYCSEKAYFHTPFTRIGVVAEGCSTYTFPKILGQSKAGDMLYLGYKMNALEAKHYGLVSEIFEHGKPNDVLTYVGKISTLSAESISAIKRLTKRWNEKRLLEVHAEEVNELVKRLQSPDFFDKLLTIMTRKSKL